MKRLTIPVPDDLHRAVKVACAADHVSVTAAVGEILKREFGSRAEQLQRDQRGRFRKTATMEAAE